jgi:N-acetyltransferase 10
MRKKIDDRIKVLLENGIKLKHRSLFVIVGDRGRDQVYLKNDQDVYLYRLLISITC